MFLVPQLQNDTSTEYRILKSILQVLFLFIYGVCIIVCAVWPVPMFPWVGMKEEVEPLPLAFQYLILMLWRPCDLNLVMIYSLASKCQDFKFGMPVFQPFYEMKLKTSKFKVLAFWSQWRYHYQIQIIRSLYQKNQILKP